MAGNGKTQWKVDGMANPDTDGDQGFDRCAAIVAHLEQRGGIEQIEAVVGEPG